MSQMRSPVRIYEIKHLVFDLNRYKLSNENQCGNLDHGGIDAG